MDNNATNIRRQIKCLFDDNELEDLKKFLDKRKCLNATNVYMLYLFHLVQSAGILTTSVGTSFSDTRLIWAGIALNMVASLIQIYEKINATQLKKLMADIQAIKDDKYVDESPLVDMENHLMASLQRPLFPLLEKVEQKSLLEKVQSEGSEPLLGAKKQNI